MNPARLIGNYYCGKSSKGWKLLKLLFVHCGISLITEKKNVTIPYRKPVPKKRLCFSIDEFLDRSLANLANLWKRTLSSSEVERSITVGVNDLYHLRRGWEKPEDIFGYPTRWTRYIAYVFLRRRPEDTILEIECQAPVDRLGKPVAGEVSIDGGPWSEFCLDSDGVKNLSFDLTEMASEIVEVRIRTPQPWKGNDVYPGKYDDCLFFGLGVKSLGLGK